MGKCTQGRVHRYFGFKKKKSDLLANTSSCKIHGNMYFLKRGYIQKREFIFPSSEHYYVAHFLSKESDISRLAVNGDLSTIEDGMNLVTSDDNIEYGDNHVGMVAKLLAKRNSFGKRSVAEKLGIEMSNEPFEAYGMKNKKSTVVAIWKTILNNKFYQNPEHRRQLLLTSNDILVEFSNSHKNIGFWYGNVIGGTVLDESRIMGGDLKGGNFMGKCMMSTRKDMKKLISRPFLKMNLKEIKMLD